MKKRVNHYARDHFGDESEDYLASLFFMARHPNGSLRPDLVSVNGRYSPKLSIEAKSGLSQKCGHMKGNMVSYQLHYAVTSHQDYRQLFGEDLPNESLLPGESGFYLNSSSVAYYYALISRSSGPTTEELKTKWDRIRSNFGNQILIPSEIAFDSFVAHIHLRNQKPIVDIVEELKVIIKEDILYGNSHAEERKKDPQSRQNIQSKDMFAIFNNEYRNPSLERTSGDSIKRVEIIKQLYGEERLDKLKRIIIPGPNETKVFVLAEPDHYELFDVQLRKTVRERIPTIERIVSERQIAIDSLKKARRVISPGLFKRHKKGEQYHLDTSKLSEPEMRSLEELLRWSAKNEVPLSSRISEFHSDATKYHSGDQSDEEYNNALANGKGDLVLANDIPF